MKMLTYQICETSFWSVVILIYDGNQLSIYLAPHVTDNLKTTDNP